MALSPMGEASVVAGELEKVRQLGAFGVFYERDDVFLTKIEKRTDIEIVSNRAARIPVQMTPGGAATQSAANGTGMGRGSGTDYKVMQVSTLFFQLAVEITLLTQWATDSDAKARFNAVKREVQNGTKQFRAFLDKIAHTAGNGVLATTSGTSNGTTLTLDSAQLFTQGMKITMYDTDQSDQRNASVASYVTGVDVPNNQITIDAAFSEGVTTDKVCVGGLSGATPTSLYGVPYFHNGASSGLVLSLDRATYPQLRTPTVAANSALTPAQPRQLLTRIRQALGVATPLKEGFWLAHPNQVAAWEELSVLIQTTTPGGSVPDPLYNVGLGGSVSMSTRPMVEDLNQSKTRIEYIIPSVWGRAVVKDVDLVKIGDQTVFPTYSTTDGAPNSSFIWYLGTQFQLFCENPRAGGYISALTNPQGYL